MEKSIARILACKEKMIGKTNRRLFETRWVSKTNRGVKKTRWLARSIDVSCRLSSRPIDAGDGWQDLSVTIIQSWLTKENKDKSKFLA
jgi:hypothetical protein